MPLKGMIREFHDMKAGRGNISRRSFDTKMSQLQRARSHSAASDNRVYKTDALRIPQQSCWGNMPPELLRDIIQRIEESETTWPSRKGVVACASVCSTWRDITKDLVKTPEQSGKLTFPISLKQPGPRNSTMQCFIKRDRITLTYYLYLGLTPTLVENGKFLLAARKFRRATSTDYIISLDAEDMSRGGDTYVGKLRSNFLGTKFSIYDNQPLHCGAITSFNRSGKGVGSKQISSQVPAGGAFNIAHIVYERNMLGTRGPRRMQCTLPSIPVSAVEEGGSVPTSTDNLGPFDCSFSSVSLLRSRATVADDASTTDSGTVSDRTGKDAPLMLKNKSPRWHEQLQCWCLNFRGRVTVASVKNFQLVAAVEPSPQGSQVDQDKVLLQFGKIGKDTFTMDYRYPLSAFQAFAICLSSFDTKLACE